MEQFFLVHSSVDGHFHCFQMLAMLNMAGVQDCQPVTFFVFCLFFFFFNEDLESDAYVLID